MRRLLVMFFISICIGVAACASESTSIEQEQEKAINVETDKEITNDIVEEKKTEKAKEEMKDKSVENDEKEEKNYRKGYSYFAPTRINDGIEHGLGFNMPEDYMYNTNESSNAKFVFNKGDEIVTIDRNEWYAERYNNYLETGEWEAVWEEKIEEVHEVETSYGIVHVLSGYSETLECIVDNCLLDYDGDMWLIERKRTENSQDIKELIKEILTPKDKTSSKEKGKSTKMEVSEDRVKSIRVNLEETNYGYYLGEIDYVHNIDSFKLKKIFGVNIPEGYREANTAYSQPEGMPDLIAYEKIGFYNDAGESIQIGFPENAYYLKKFLSSNEYEEGEEIEEYGLGWFLSLNMLEKGNMVETAYGSARIIYQTATDNYSGNTVKCEIVVFNINNHDIVISYQYHDGETASFENKIEKLLPELLEP